MGLLDWLHRPVVVPITQDDVEPAPVPRPEIEDQLDVGTFTLIKEALLAGIAVTKLQQRLASEAAVKQMQHKGE